MERLSKRMAAAGVASRRKCEEIIFEGRVKVNGTVVTKPETHVSYTDHILVDQQTIRKEKKVYYLLNKPKGFVCSNASSKSVLKLLPEKNRLFTVGRLDKDTEGLLLITNDGIFANKVIHPSNNIHKEYLVKTHSEIMHEHLVRISEGVRVEGTFVKPVRVKKVRKGTLKVTVSEGKKHEVRHLVEAAGLEVHQLTRIRIGGLQLGSLPIGKWRALTPEEKTMLCPTLPSKS